MSQQVMSAAAIRKEGIPSPVAVFSIAWRQRKLIYSLAMREVSLRYKGSMLGGVWTFLMPLLLIALYSFVFGSVFRSRWIVPPGGKGTFPLILFGGMIWVNVFIEGVGRSPGLMMENVAYIKKVVFPLEIMPYVALLSSLVTAVSSLSVLGLFYVAAIGLPPVTILWLPVVVFPLGMMSLGVMWFLGSLGVYLRDLKPFVGMLATALVFLTPQFYPLSSFPEWARSLAWLNPLTPVLEQVRAVMFWGWSPDWLMLGIYAGIAWLCAWGGLVWYSKTHRGFADVV